MEMNKNKQNSDINIFSLCTKFLSGGKGYIPVNRTLAESITMNGALLIGDLLFKYCYYYSNNRLTEDGYFYATIQDIERSTLLNAYAQNKLIKQLKELNLITVKYGSDCVRYFKINFSVLKELIYKEVEVSEFSEFLKIKNSTSQNLRTRVLKNSEQIINNINNKLEVVEEKNPTDSTKTTKHNSKNRNISQIKQYILDNKEIINQKFLNIGKPQLLDSLVNYLDKMNNNIPYRQLKELSIEELELVSQVVLAFRRNNILEYKDIQEMFRLITSVNYDTPETCVTLIEQIQQRNLLKEKGIRYY